jgi:hypothetical protein
MDNGRMGSERHAVGVHRRFVAGSREVMRMVNSLVVHTVKVAQVIILSALCLVGYYAMDREPPFAVLSVTPAEAKPGEYITIEAKVRRDTWRRCDAEFSRYLHDASGARFDLGSSVASAEMIGKMDSASPGVLRVSVLLPATMNPGPARLETALNYFCNKVHRAWPIVVTTDLPFLVLPASP